MRWAVLATLAILACLTLSEWHRQPAAAQSLSALTCVDYDTDATFEEYGRVTWTWKYCVNYLSARSGIPPSVSGEKGLCSEGIDITIPTARELDCNWRSRITVADARTSFRRLYCAVMREEYGFENDNNVGALIVACADRRAFLRAVTGE